MTRIDFETLALSLRPLIVRTARSIVGNGDEAEDIAQDTLLKLWSIRDSLDRYKSVEALVTVIARNYAINSLRLSGRMSSVPVEQLESVAVTELSPEEQMLIQEDKKHEEAVLARLPESQRILIRLRHVEGYDNSTIAAMLGSSEGAVRTALSRARRHVAELFAKTNII